MMTTKEFFDDVAKEILEKCKTEEDYINVYLKVKSKLDETDATYEEMAEYYESGASERLAMATQRYRIRTGEL